MSVVNPTYDIIGDKPKKKVIIKRKPKKPPLPPYAKDLMRNKEGKLVNVGAKLKAQKERRQKAKATNKRLMAQKERRIADKKKRETNERLMRQKARRIADKELVKKKVKGGFKNVDVSTGKELSKKPMSSTKATKQLQAIAISITTKRRRKKERQKNYY